MKKIPVGTPIPKGLWHGGLGKLKVFAGELGAQILKPFYPASSLYRVVNDDAGV